MDRLEESFFKKMAATVLEFKKRHQIDD